MAGAVDDVFSYLEDQGIAGGSTSWTLLRRRVMDAPAENQLVVITEDGGARNEIHADEGIGDTALADPAVLVTVRGNVADGDATRSKAGEIKDALHGLLGATVGATPYLRIAAQTPEPIFAGFDERGRPLHTISFRMLRLVSAS